MGDNIRMDHKEMGWEGVDWMHMAQERNQAECCRKSNERQVPYQAENFLTS